LSNFNDIVSAQMQFENLMSSTISHHANAPGACIDPIVTS
jgi:hypothetical protein